MEELTKEINAKWDKLKDGCEFYNPQYYRGHPELTEEWCNSKYNKPPQFGNLGRCLIGYCPKLRRR